MADSNSDSVLIKVYRSTTGKPSEYSYQNYEVPFQQEMTVLQALEYIYENLDSSLGFRRFCCGVQYCNSCMMSINGHSSHACLTKLEKKEYVLEPLRSYPVIKDLIVDLKEKL